VIDGDIFKTRKKQSDQQGNGKMKEPKNIALEDQDDQSY